MSERFRLRELKNGELVSGLVDLVRQSTELTADVLARLSEIERRDIHLELGYSSLHAYCVGALGMSEGAAGRRVIAARVCRTFPEAYERVAQGELHLSAICALAPRLSPENSSELLDACRRKTRRQIEELLAARFPKADVPEQVRRLPVGASGVVGEDAPSQRREVEPLSAHRFGVHFTADSELKRLMDRARGLASHRVSDSRLATLMKLVFTEFVAGEEKRRFAKGGEVHLRRKEKKAPTPNSAEGPPARATSSGQGHQATPPGGVTQQPSPWPEPTTSSPLARGAHAASRRITRKTRTRYISASVRRAVYERDGARCTFVAPDGRRCEATQLLQFDHILPWGRDGDPSEANLRLRCAAHNHLHARKCYGARHVEARIEQQRARAAPGSR